MGSIKSCHIIPPDGDNVGDHLPIRIVMELTCSGDTQWPIYYIKQSTPLANWKNHVCNEPYVKTLTTSLESLATLVIPEDGQSSVQGTMDNDVSRLSSCRVTPDATREAGRTPKPYNKPKKYWCPEPSRARDTKRFWWHLWVANDRPRSGMVFSCYKNAKRFIRDLWRRCIADYQNETYRHIETLLVRDSNAFW